MRMRRKRSEGYEEQEKEDEAQQKKQRKQEVRYKIHFYSLPYIISSLPFETRIKTLNSVKH